MTAAPVVEVRKLTVRYSGAPVIEDVDLSLDRDAFVAIIGPNGGGKSTLLKALLGLVRPDRGEVRLWGRPCEQARHKVGYVPQHASFRSSFPISVEEVATMGRLYERSVFRRLGRADRRIVDEILDRMDLTRIRSQRASELSGGQRQRLLIARALTTEPELLLLDEPTASLDARATEQVYSLLAELNEEIPIVMISHDLTSIGERVKSIGCLNRHFHYHGTRELTDAMVSATYGCPVELIAHGLPHRVLARHAEPGGPAAHDHSSHAGHGHASVPASPESSEPSP